MAKRTNSELDEVIEDIVDVFGQQVCVESVCEGEAEWGFYDKKQFFEDLRAVLRKQR